MTGHVLAAVASKPGAGAELLREWRLSPEVLSRAARILTDDHGDAVESSMQRARDLAGSSQPSGLRLLAALFADRGTSAFRTIDQSGAEKLRTVVMRIATSPRRVEPGPATSHLSVLPASHLADAPVLQVC
jgi:hypothetical protein